MIWDLGYFWSPGLLITNTAEEYFQY